MSVTGKVREKCGFFCFGRSVGTLKIISILFLIQFTWNNFSFDILISVLANKIISVFV